MKVALAIVLSLSLAIRHQLVIGQAMSFIDRLMIFLVLLPLHIISVGAALLFLYVLLSI